MRFLYCYFVKKEKDAISFFDEKMKFHLCSFSENQSREKSLDFHNRSYNNEIYSKQKAPEKKECTPFIVEMHLLQKLSLHLDQKIAFGFLKD